MAQYHNGGKKELELLCYKVMHSMWTGTVFENRLVKNVYDRTTLIILSITDTLRQKMESH